MIDLQPFCGTEETRYYLMKPFSKDGFTWATNGDIIVRVPLRLDAAEFDAKIPLNVAYPFKWHEGATFEALPKVKWPQAADKSCETCGGSCHQHACPDCECICEACDGTGRETIRASVLVRGALFDIKYIQMVAALPGAQFSTAPKSNEGPTPFVFDEGIGCIMALRRPYKLHLGDIEKLERV